MNVKFKEFIKRIMDITIAIIALPMALPIIIIIGLAIILETPGNMIFCQKRIGRYYKPFCILKLRTMVKNAENIGAGIYMEKNDLRLTKVGIFARRFSIDELPQLFNVLKGDMSIVGPRPMLPVTVEEYKADYEIILKVKPGITGLSQVSGRNDLSREERLVLDKKYVNEWSLLLDLQILLKTMSVVVTGKGQRNDQSREDVEIFNVKT